VSLLKLEKKYFITAELEFTTAFHIGSGMAGESDTDSGILMDMLGKPVLPGSSLKGKFRSDAEKISHALNMTACFLDNNLANDSRNNDDPEINCVTGASNNESKQIKQQVNNQKNKYSYLESHYLCDICKVFGSKMHGSRIFFSDGKLKNYKDVVYKRDGVVIDRDSERARDKLKYNFEVAPDETSYEINIELENPSDKELSLIRNVLYMWKEGFKIGGLTSRGLGNAKLKDIKIKLLDFKNSESFTNYIKNNTLKEVSLENLVK
jgi:CRISPR-associated RAMP protein (TIGR02581 family)